MITNADDLPRDSVQRAEVAVVGAGAAGITIARALGERGVSVMLLESGGFEPDEPTTALGNMASSGEEYLVGLTRLRYFGGTTNHWAGFCRPLDPLAYEARSWVPQSGWPFGPEELAPWYDAAAGVLQFGESAVGPDAWSQRLEPLLETDTVTSVLWRISPTRFGEVYRDELASSEQVTVVLGANAVELRSPPDGSSVDEIRVATLAGNAWTVVADAVVLATGGLEVPRLLLASRGSRPEGLGNGNDLVGRFFMDHYNVPLGTLALAEEVEPDSYVFGIGRTDAIERDGERFLAGLTLTDDVQREERLLGANVTLNEISEPPEGSDAVAALVGDVTHRGRGRLYELHGRVEPTPNPESRVTLTDRTDALGVPVADLHWAFDPADAASLLRTTEILARELGRAELGRIHVPEPPEFLWESHHLGTARMDPDPARGVVDENCRIHGVANCYVAGSAVFPTAGHANPTLTIVALALRLAETLAPADG